MNEVISLWKKLLEATELKGVREFSWRKAGSEGNEAEH